MYHNQDPDTVEYSEGGNMGGAPVFNEKENIPAQSTKNDIAKKPKQLTKVFVNSTNINETNTKFSLLMECFWLYQLNYQILPLQIIYAHHLN